MAQAKVGDTVKVHYEGMLNDGSVLTLQLGESHLNLLLVRRW